MKSALALLALLVPALASAHPIDEVQSQALVDMRSTDGRSFEVVIFLTSAHLQTYRRAIGQLDLPPDRDRQELAMAVRQAFEFTPCALHAVDPDRQLGERSGGAWVGMRYQLRCAEAPTRLELVRQQFSVEKTRTTLLWTIDIAGREPIQALMPPHLQALSLDLTTGQVVGSQRGTKQPPWKDHVTGTAPTSPRTLGQFPDPAARYSEVRPPWPILQAWAEAGALHLATGPDHLLFLLTLVLGATSAWGLAAGVTGFSLGHLLAMAVALANHWAPVPLLDVVIGGTIMFSAWRAWRWPHTAPWALGATSVVFGLIHGFGFGQGLAELTAGSDAIWWPLLSFGLGLDLAQTAWVALAGALWAVALRGRDRAMVEALRARAAVSLAIGGGCAVVYALYGAA